MKYVYRGPADAVVIDGVRINKDSPTELTNDQVQRLRADPTVVVDAYVEAPEPTPRARARATPGEKE